MYIISEQQIYSKMRAAMKIYVQQPGSCLNFFVWYKNSFDVFDQCIRIHHEQPAERGTYLFNTAKLNQCTWLVHPKNA